MSLSLHGKITSAKNKAKPMNDEFAETLGQRLMACKGFRWMAGMLDMDGHRVLKVYNGKPVICGDGIIDDPPAPDLRDPATKGCAMALMRDRWPEAATFCAAPGVWTIDAPDEKWETVWILGEDTQHMVSTEAEAIVAAMELDKEP